MRRLLCLAVVPLLLVFAAVAYADDSEDLQLAGGLFSRKWYDWAGEVARGLANKEGANREIRQQAAILHVQIVRTLAIATGDESLEKEADRLQEEYEKELQLDTKGLLNLELLKLRLEQAVGFVRRAEVEPDDGKRAELQEKAAGLFEKLGADFEAFITEARLDVAKYPPEHKWHELLRKATPQERKKFFDTVWKRDYGEYLYANSFVPYSKVVPEEKKAQVVTRGLKKFLRFIDGKQEHAGDFDPPALGQQGPQEPSSRCTFKMLEYYAGIGRGQCHLELGQHKDAIEWFDYMVQAEIPFGSEESPQDIARIVDIRLQAYYLEGYAYNRWNKPADAEKILREMFSRSGKEIQPDRPGILAYWKKNNRAEVALMPDVRENVYGKLAAFQLAKALGSQGRHTEAIDEVFRVFKIERERRTTGREGPFEVEAAKTMAELSRQVADVEFPIGAAFAVARGFYYQKQWDNAIYYYKKVYGSPGSPEEIEEYAPEALFELGKLLYSNERYLEAGIAFAEICKSFRDFSRIDRVAELLQASCRRARAAAGKAGTFEEELVKWKDTAFELRGRHQPPAPHAVDALLKAGDYERVIDIYAEVPKTYEEPGEDGKVVVKTVPFYAYARAQIGYCHYRLYLKWKEPDTQVAFEKLKKAIAALEEALEEAPALEDRRAEAMARYYLAKCLTEDVWEDKQAQANARKALKLLTAFTEKFKDSRSARKYMPDTLATIAFVSFELKDYAGMHEAVEKLEKEQGAGRLLMQTCARLCELLMKAGEHEKAADYAYKVFRAAGDRPEPKTLIWVGEVLYSAKSFEKAIEVLEKFLAALPDPKKRSGEEKKQAVRVKVLLAESRYAAGEYEAAAGLFDILRRTAACPRCGHEEVLKWQDFGKPLEACPVCRKEDVKLEKVHDTSFQIQEGAAKSYLAAYERLSKKDMLALNRAQDIYQRILSRINKSGWAESHPDKYWEIVYTVLKIWFYRRDFGRIVGDVDNILLLSDWEKAIPVKKWRDKIKELYYAALKELEKNR